MQDVLSRLRSLHRPRLLVRTARIGANGYSRDRDLQRILSYGSPPRPAVAIIRLMELEEEINRQRLSGDAGYTIPRHVDVLTALMGEADYLGRPEVDKSTETNSETVEAQEQRQKTGAKKATPEPGAAFHISP
ncbi:DUF6477 family protein [Pseudophaeobacter sp.]|uniref:DUF6477 family protein n=1 Tax=Pseudophaeobacter sp. TaxID=1971739 RepID=UPI00329715C7